MKKIIIACMLCPTLTFAQHPCDRPELATQTVSEGAAEISVCTPTVPASWRVDRDGQLTTLTMRTNGVKSGEGLLEFLGALSMSAGVFKMRVLLDAQTTPEQTVTVTAVVPDPVRQPCSDGLVVRPVGAEFTSPGIRPNRLETERARYVALGWTELSSTRVPPLHYLRLRCVGLPK